MSPSHLAVYKLTKTTANGNSLSTSHYMYDKRFKYTFDDKSWVGQYNWHDKGGGACV